MTRGDFFLDSVELRISASNIFVLHFPVSHFQSPPWNVQTSNWNIVKYNLSSVMICHDMQLIGRRSRWIQNGTYCTADLLIATARRAYEYSTLFCYEAHETCWRLYLWVTRTNVTTNCTTYCSSLHDFWTYIRYQDVVDFWSACNFGQCDALASYPRIFAVWTGVWLRAKEREIIAALYARWRGVAVTRFIPSMKITLYARSG